ncbi:cAMP phosphodiesterases class-II-domain-containing protein [Daedaleopsis nitida]|nr:cAMP phosphodiesterases class-II-domain-containing protein [Daedaleopsis nitida]
MASFDMVVVGCGGGPSEDNLSSYLLKAHDATWEDGIIALEAGSGLGAMARLLDSHPDAFAPDPSESETKGESNGFLTTAAEVYSRIRCVPASSPSRTWHEWRDNVLSLRPCFRQLLPRHARPSRPRQRSGSLRGLRRGPAKLVYGAKKTLEGVASIFSGDIWPKLASWADAEVPGSTLLLSPLSPDAAYTNVARDISVRMMPISHGQLDDGPYPCTAYFVRHDAQNREFLFFGDVEPDTVSPDPQNREVWRAAAPKIPDTLSAIFIECSWPSGREDKLLYGHLNPEHLVDELSALAVEVAGSRQRAHSRGQSNGARKKKRRNHDSLPSTQGVLTGLRVFIIHCKDDIQGTYDEPIHKVIAGQVRSLVEAKGFGAEILAVEQGMHIGASFAYPSLTSTHASLAI